jgi:hypothetical protein
MFADEQDCLEMLLHQEEWPAVLHSGQADRQAVLLQGRQAG